MIFKKAVPARLQHRAGTAFRGGTDYFHKKHNIILGVLLAARCVFYRTPPGALPGALPGVSAQICGNEPGIHELKMSENVPHGHRMRPNRSLFSFVHSHATP